MHVTAKNISLTLLKVLILGLILAGIIVALFLTSKPKEKLTGGAIAANGPECAAIGKSIVDQGGSAGDVAVAVLICEGITCPQSSGLGGGFLLTIYTKATGKIETLNAREVAPKLSNSTMFLSNGEAAARGGLAVAVPGELKGLWELHQKYGKLPWAKLIEPNIELARNGHVVSRYLDRTLKRFPNDIKLEPTMREIFVDPNTNEIYKLNDIIKRPKLAETLEIIKKEGANALYGGGSLVEGLVKDIKERGGIIVEEDFLDYRVRWSKPLSTTLKDDSTYHTTPLPSNGGIVCFMLNLLRDYDLKDDALSYHRIVEAMKFAYAKRTLLGDEPSDEMKELMRNLTSVEYANEIRELIRDDKTSNDFEYYGAKFSNPEDSGTIHLSILMPNGDAVSATSTINYLFGAFWRSKSTGIILNDEMDDFSTPGVINIYGFRASPANYIQPGKHPLSSMTPSIILDKKGDVKLAIGGAGGSRIPSGVMFSMIKYLFMGQNLTEAIKAPRIHHQLAPMQLDIEPGFDESIVSALNLTFGHNILEESDAAAVVAVAQVNGDFEASPEPRRGGSVEIF